MTEINPDPDLDDWDDVTEHTHTIIDEADALYEVVLSDSPLEQQHSLIEHHLGMIEARCKLIREVVAQEKAEAESHTRAFEHLVRFIN